MLKNKSFLVLLLFIFVLFTISCDKQGGNIDFKIDIEKTELYIDEEVLLKIDCINCTYRIEVNNDNISIIDNCKIKAVKEGKTTIKIIANEDNSISKEICVEIKAKEISHDFSFIIQNNLELNKEYNYQINKECEDDEITLIVDEKYLFVDKERLTITSLKEGTTEIVILNEYTNEKIIKEIIIYDVSEEAITNYLFSLYENLEVRSDINFVKNYYDSNIEFIYYSNDSKYLSDEGKYSAPILSLDSELTVMWYIDGEEYCAFIPIKIIGSGSEFDVVIKYIDGKIPQETRRALYLPTSYFDYGTLIDWYVDGILLDDGVFEFERTDDENYYITLKCIIKINNEERIKEYTVKCVMKDSEAKALKIFDLYKNEFASMLVEKDIIFPEFDELYSAKLNWESFNSLVLSSDGKYNQPLETTIIKMKLIVTLGEFEKIGFVEMTIKGKDRTDKWDVVEDFLAIICKKEIKTQKYYLYGYEEGYTSVRTQNIGYLPFYQNEELKVTEDILPSTSDLKPNRMRSSTKYITLHNTGMAHPTATAKGLNEYIHTTDRIASWHFSVDDTEAYQHLKLGEIGWHAGDGGYNYGDFYYNDTNRHSSIGGGNNNSIGIEMCVYAGCDFNMTMRNTAKLVSKLLVMYGLTPSDIRQHYDFSGKNCPQVIREAGRWEEMLELITIEYIGRTTLEGVTFKWESLSKEFLDDTGKVINNPKTKPTLKYKVSVTIDSETKEYIFESILNSI